MKTIIIKTKIEITRLFNYLNQFSLKKINTNNVTLHDIKKIKCVIDCIKNSKVSIDVMSDYIILIKYITRIEKKLNYLLHFVN